MKRDARSIAFTAAKLLVAVGLVSFGIMKGWVEVADFGHVLKRWRLALLALAGMCSIPFIGAVRWRALVRTQGLSLSYGLALKLTYIGLFWSVFMPGSIFGDFFKAYYVARGLGREKKAESLTTIVLDRAVGLVGLTVLASFVALLSIPAMRANPTLRQVGYMIILLLLVSIVIFGLALSKRLRAQRKRKLAERGRFWQTIDRVDDAIHLYRHHKLIVLGVVAISILAHVIQCGVLWCFAEALAPGVISLPAMLLLAPICFVVNAIPIAPGGAGQGEVVSKGLLERSHGFAQGFTMFLCWRITNLIAVSPGAVIWALHRAEFKAAEIEMVKDEPEPTESG